MQPEQRTISGTVYLDCQHSKPAPNKLVVLESFYAIDGNSSTCPESDSAKTDTDGFYLINYNFYNSKTVEDFFNFYLELPDDSLLSVPDSNTSSFDIVLNDTFTIRLKIFFSTSYTTNDTFYYGAFREPERFLVGPFPEVYHDTLHLSRVYFYNKGYNSTYITFGIGWNKYYSEIGHITSPNNIRVDHTICNPIDSASILVD